MNYIVTGGAGFIGSNLVKELIKRGNKVTIVDDLSTGSHSNVQGLRVYYGSDIIGKSLELIDREEKVDGIFHLGMPSSTPLYDKDPLLVAKVVEEATCIFEFAKKNKVKVVFASTSNLYNGLIVPWSEDLPIRPSSLYTEARYFVEKLSELYWMLYKAPSVGLRLFSVYGPNEISKGKLANVVSQMAWAKKVDKPFIIYGDGKQTRDSIFVSDVVEAFIKAMESSTRGFFNVGTGVALSFNEIANLIEVKVEYILNPGNALTYVFNQCADTWAADMVLGFRAKVGLKEGIKWVMDQP